MSSGGGGWPPGEADGFGHDGRYGDEFSTDHGQGRYFDESGYEWSESSARSQSQGDPRARGRADQHGQTMGRHSGMQPAPSYGDPYGQDGYGQGPYRQDSYGDAYGQGWQFSGRDGYDQGGYDQGGYDQGSYGQAGYDSYGEPGYGRDGYARDGYARDGYGREFGSDRYAGGSYRQDGYGGDYYGQPAPGYGQDNGYIAPGGPVRQALGPGSSDQDVISGYQADTHQADTHQADTGSFDSFDGRGDRGSADGWFSQPSDTGSFSPDAARAGGYDQWHDAADDADGWDGDEPAEHDDDWEEDPDGGLLSTRFGGGADGGAGSGRGSRRRTSRTRRPKRLRGKFAFTAAILAGALVLGAVADFGYERFQAWHTSRYGDYTGAGSGQVHFTVQPGAVLSSLGAALVKAQVIMEVRPFDSAAAAASNASGLQPGVYLLHRHMSAALAVRYLLSPGHRVNDQVTIIEGTRASAIAQALAKQTGIPVSQFTQIIEHPPASLGLPSWAVGKTAEGFLFPDTYTLLPKMTALQILRTMVTEFKQKIGAINLVGASRKVFTTPWHALIVGSLIQAEAGSPKDFPKISRVVWDRLLQGMKLQFDSTVFYAMGKYGTAATAQQQNFPSPYNTYVHTGLPPGPIGNPGIAAINAAVHASQGTRYLYFVTDTRHKPYITHFTASYQTFLQWKQEFEG